MVGESKFKARLLLVLGVSVWIGLVGLLGLQRLYQNGCTMTYMYPTYIPLPPTPDTLATKYGLFLYHEGWKKIDYELQLVKLSGVPVLFIPGNGGSYKQVRSLAAESDRAFNGGPMEETFYQEAVPTPEEAGHADGGSDEYVVDGEVITRKLRVDAKREGQYPNHLDWFSVDLDGEHSAMDGRILEEHTEYVVQAIHRILDRYKVSLEARSKDGTDMGQTLPTSVILVGHSMGGFVARAAVVHPGLRKGAVRTVVTLSSPHLLPPVAMQPSLGHFFSRVNKAWKVGYSHKRSRLGWLTSDVVPDLSDVVVISITGGPRDYQVRSKMASLDGIVPPSNGLTIGAPGMRNVWLSMEHQSILWCNQLVVQVSHTLLQIVDSSSGQQFLDPQKRLAIFISNLRSPLPQIFDWIPVHQPPQFHASKLLKLSSMDEKDHSSNRKSERMFSCPNLLRWSDESHEKDLYIETSSVTVLAMDGRRRWLDIKKLGSDGRDHFALVTNLLPCTGVRIHLWPEKSKIVTGGLSVNERVVEVTRKMVQLPAGPAPSQIEPGGQTEQASPSGVLRLTPEELRSFRFITISVAPRLTISGRPPPAASMAVGQFFRPIDGAFPLSPLWLLSSAYNQKGLSIEENHPLILNLSVSVSMGVLPLSMGVKTLSCGIKDSVFVNQQAGDNEHSGLCKLRCFPPVAFIWDPLSGLSVMPNFFSATVAVDSSPALWGAQRVSKDTTILLMMDPHCAYKVNVAVSLSAAATRFLLVHGLQITGSAVAVLLFALMHQTRAWELDQSVPSVLSSMEQNLLFPAPFLLFTVIPLVLYSILEMLAFETTSSFVSFVLVSIICYCVANGAVALLAIITHVAFYAAATLQVFFKLRWQARKERAHVLCFCWLRSSFREWSSIEVFRTLKSNPILFIALAATVLVFFMHPALGLIVLLLAHAVDCYSSLCSCLADFFRSHQHQKGARSPNGGGDVQMACAKSDGNHLGSQKTMISFSDTQLEAFHYRQTLLLLHLVVTAMLFPSLIAWGQRLAIDRTSPWFLDSVLSFGLILHGLFANKPDANFPLFSRPQFSGGTRTDVGLSLIYAISGLYCYLSGLSLSPYKIFYALAILGLIATVFRILERNGRAKGDFTSKRHHFHRH